MKPTLTNPIKVRKVKKARKAGPRRGWEARALAKVQIKAPTAQGVTYRPLKVATSAAHTYVADASNLKGYVGGPSHQSQPTDVQAIDNAQAIKRAKQVHTVRKPGTRRLPRYDQRKDVVLQAKLLKDMKKGKRA